MLQNKIHPEKIEVINTDGWVNVTFKADEICKNGTPHLDFTLFCLLNDLIMKIKEDEYEEDSKEIYIMKVNACILIDSESEETNKRAIKMLEKFEVSVWPDLDSL